MKIAVQETERKGRGERGLGRTSQQGQPLPRALQRPAVHLVGLRECQDDPLDALQPLPRSTSPGVTDARHLKLHRLRQPGVQVSQKTAQALHVQRRQRLAGDHRAGGPLEQRRPRGAELADGTVATACGKWTRRRNPGSQRGGNRGMFALYGQALGLAVHPQVKAARLRRHPVCPVDAAPAQRGDGTDVAHVPLPGNCLPQPFTTSSRASPRMTKPPVYWPGSSGFASRSPGSARHSARRLRASSSRASGAPRQ